MPTPRKIEHSRAISWEITYRLDGRSRGPVAVRHQGARPGRGRQRAQCRWTGWHRPGRWQDHPGRLHSALGGGATVPAHTLAMYNSHLKNHILPSLGRRPMS